MRDDWGAAGQELVVVNGATVAGQGFESEVEVIQRQGAVVYDDLVEQTLLSGHAVVAADVSPESAAAHVNFYADAW